MYFSVSTLFYALHASSNSVNEDTMWEEIIYLIVAPTQEDAVEQAKIIAAKDQVSYSTDNDEVSWIFSKILHISPIEYKKIENGSEIFSRFLTTEQVNCLSHNFFVD